MRLEEEDENLREKSLIQPDAITLGVKTHITRSSRSLTGSMQAILIQRFPKKFKPMQDAGDGGERSLSSVASPFSTTTQC